MPQDHSNRERAREARFVLREAIRAARPTSEKSSYPVDMQELSTIVTHQRVFHDARTGKLAHGDFGSRPPSGMPDNNRARRILARGIPPGELTRVDGSSSVPVLNGAR